MTDHKPLLGLFSNLKPISHMASGRIQRWALLMQAYRFDLVHRSGEKLGTADALSRLPLSMATDSTTIPADWTMLVNFLDYSPVSSQDVGNSTRRDVVLSKVSKYLEVGWPSTTKDPEILPYHRRQSELSLEGGCVLWGSRVVIPSKLQPIMLKELHSSHTGAARMKELARSYVWWPGLDKALEKLTSSCPQCLEKRPMPPKSELHPWEWPKVPWHRVHVDHAGPVNGNYFLILVDAHTKWVEICKVSGTTSKETIARLQHMFTQFGLPVSLVSDNGPCFTSQEFKTFTNNCGVKHLTTAVYKPATNGLAERMVQTFKKALTASGDPLQLTLDKFLFNYRMTPHSTTGRSPAELMFGRKLRTRFDMLWPSENLETRVHDKQEKQKWYHAKHPRKPNLDTNSPVMARNYARGSKWLPGIVERRTGPVSFKVRLQNGNLIKRHQDQLHMREPEGLQEIDPGDGAVTTETPPVSPASIADQVSLQSPQLRMPALPRRSSRQRKPVERLDL